MDPEDIVEELHGWFSENLHLLSSYKYMLKEGSTNFMELNKNERLEMSGFRKLAEQH